MGKTTVTITPALKKKLKDTALKVRQDLASSVTEELKYEAEQSMITFYTQYTPSRYMRKYGFFDRSYKSAYKNPGHGTIYGGIVITAEGNKNDYYYFEKTNGKWHANPVERSYEITGELNISRSNPVEEQAKTIGEITNMVYSGYHGYTEIFREMYRDAHNGQEPNFREPPVMSPSPYERIKARRDEFLKKFCTSEQASLIAQKHWR